MNYARNVFGKVEKLIRSQMYEGYENLVGLMQMFEIILVCAFISFLRVGKDIVSLLFEYLIFFWVKLVNKCLYLSWEDLQWLFEFE